MITSMAEFFHPAADLGPPFLNVRDFFLLHRTVEHEAHDEVCMPHPALEALHRGALAGAKDFIPVNRILEFLERGRVIVEVGHRR